MTQGQPRNKQGAPFGVKGLCKGTRTLKKGIRAFVCLPPTHEEVHGFGFKVCRVCPDFGTLNHPKAWATVWGLF